MLEINYTCKCFAIGILLLTVSCATTNTDKSTDGNACSENLEFKAIYFGHIKNVENSVTKNQDESFRRSLNFISNYSKVSFESMANYAKTYPYGTFMEDRKKWLEWYEANKCNNIQLKDSL
jgi:hypothetical protein